MKSKAPTRLESVPEMGQESKSKKRHVLAIPDGICLYFLQTCFAPQ